MPHQSAAEDLNLQREVLLQQGGEPLQAEALPPLPQEHKLPAEYVLFFSI